VLMKSNEFCQGLITICNIYKIIKLPVNRTVDTITRPNLKEDTIEYKNRIKEISHYFTKFCKNRNIETLKLNSYKNPIFSTAKASANGSSAMGFTSILDAYAVRKSGIFKTQFEIARSVYTPVAFKKWAELFRTSLKVAIPDQKIDTLVSSRLHFLKEKGGKTRVIAIPDIWSQSVLKPIHDHLFKTLKRLPNDGTFSHSGLARRAQLHTRGNPLYCYDLRAATDRMPVDLQVEILKPLLGNKLASLWKVLLVERDFQLKNDTVVRYAVGQPMGMLSSWPAMAITHHAIINYAKKDKSFYGIIGDDIVIGSKTGAEEYKHILNDLGMEISFEKSIMSDDKNNVAEIAKRLFLNGRDISPIPPDILMSSTNNIIGFTEFVRVYLERFQPNQDGSFDSRNNEVIDLIFKNSRAFKDINSHILLSCPFLHKMKILPNFPRLRSVKEMWMEGRSKFLTNDFEQYALRIANDRVNSRVTDLMVASNFRESKHLDNYPLIKEFKLQVKRNLTLLVRKINTTYIDDEADSFAEGPIADIKDLLSYPNPLNDGISMIYQSKQERRTKEAELLLQQFYKSHVKYHRI
jgi:hypothetical protein